MLNTLAKTIRFDNASKGFDPTEGGVSRYLLLAISEICEAQNELRDGRGITEIYYTDVPQTEKSKPEGFAVEIADAAIRILDIGGKFNIDFETKEDGEHEFSYGETADDWLLGIVEDIAMCHTYEPESVDFQLNLRRALEAIQLLCEANDIPLMKVIETKLAFNRTRPPKHGRQF